MKGSIIIVSFFLLGCVLGHFRLAPSFLLDGNITMYVLYFLMLQVGIGIGSDKRLKNIIRSIRPKLLLVPLATITGTLSFSAAAALLLSRWSVWDCMAAGSGFAYYSLSSILITQFKAPVYGAAIAAELGTIALMANIIREITALLMAPVFARYFGKLAPICAGGATTMDTTLPVISKYSGREMVFISILHGILLDFSVPFFISLFCSL